MICQAWKRYYTLVIPKGGEDEILGWANGKLAKHQRLSGVQFRTEFPRNALGKVN